MYRSTYHELGDDNGGLYSKKMYIRKIFFSQFRNYSHLTIYPKEGINLFIGNNAQGKTNILEGIYFLALTKTFKNTVEGNIIQFGENQAIVRAEVDNGKYGVDLEIQLNRHSKKVYKNGNNIKKYADYISNLNVVLFTPDDLDLIKGTPNYRRESLNLELSQLSREYLKRYNEYNKILKIRNEYLKKLYINSMADRRYLDILTEKLVEISICIYQYRYRYISDINCYLGKIFNQFTGMDQLHLVYQSSFYNQFVVDENTKQEMINKYNSIYAKELALGMTLIGPHRDDFSFQMGNLDLKTYGSQGQIRLAVISYKIAVANIFCEKLNQSPILLLDDILSEIDLEKINILFQVLKGDYQIFMTATGVKNVKKTFLKNVTIFNVCQGNVEKERRN